MEPGNSNSKNSHSLRIPISLQPLQTRLTLIPRLLELNLFTMAKITFYSGSYYSLKMPSH